MPVDGRAQPVVDAGVGRSSAEGQIVRDRRPRPEEAVDIVVEHGAGGIRIAEVLERAEEPPRHRRRTVHALQRRLGAGPFDSETAAILHAAAGSPPLRRDDNGAVRRVNAVQRRGFRPLQYGERLDVVRIEIGGPVGEVDPAIRERRVRIRIGREQSRIEGPVVHRQPIDDDQRLVAAADLAHASDGDRGGRARHARAARHIHACDASLQRVDEVLPLRLRDLDAPDGLLCRAQGPLGSGLPQRRHDHGIEIHRDFAQLDVDDIVGVDGALDQSGPDEPELQHLAHRGANRVVALVVARSTRVGPLDGDRHTGQGSALLTGHLTGHGLLL